MREVFCQPANMQHAVHGHTALNFQRKMIGRGRKSSERKKIAIKSCGFGPPFSMFGDFWAGKRSLFHDGPEMEKMAE